MKGFTIKCNNCGKTTSIDSDINNDTGTCEQNTNGIKIDLNRSFDITCECGNTITWY